MLHRKNDNLQILHYVLLSLSAMVVSFALVARDYRCLIVENYLFFMLWPEILFKCGAFCTADVITLLYFSDCSNSHPS